MTRNLPNALRSAPALQGALEPDHEVVIVGAGFGGMGIAIQLGRMGIRDVLILERSDDLGGTWHLNHYPGLQVDISSLAYSYSFEPNPYWSKLFATGAELKAYTQHVATKYDLRRLMRFNASVEQVAYDEHNALWTVHIEGQASVTARVLVLATGYLSRPKKPDIAGIDDFAGKVIHTAAYDHSYDMRGKRVSVIGTGATAVQLLPEIAPLVSQLHVYQRTAIWVTPRRNPPIPPHVQELFARFPITQRAARLAFTTRLEVMALAGLLYNQDLPFLTESVENLCRSYLERSIPDPELRRKLTPNYPFGCKRPTFSNRYYPVFNRANVELVTDPIDHIERDGIVTRDGQKRSIDALVLATGFRVWERDTFHSIMGKRGVELRDAWERSRYESYEGLSVPGFPNLFYLPGPYSYTGLSYFFTIESQMKHVGRVLGAMRKRKARSFEVTEDAKERFMRGVQKDFGHSVFVEGHCANANSYYFDRHGAPSLIRPTSTLRAFLRQATFPLSDYRFD
ncbi:MAG: NAD(P)/FAD-dependent oxidoreductase [Myxococcales bacterium]